VTIEKGIRLSPRAVANQAQLPRLIKNQQEPAKRIRQDKRIDHNQLINQVDQYQKSMLGNQIDQYQKSMLGNQKVQYEEGMLVKQKNQQQQGMLGNHVDQYQKSMLGNHVDQKSMVGNQMVQYQKDIQGNVLEQYQGFVEDLEDRRGDCYTSTPERWVFHLILLPKAVLWSRNRLILSFRSQSRSRVLTIATQHELTGTTCLFCAVLRIRIRNDPHHFVGSGSGILEADPDPDPRLQNWHLQPF
jgi:hypothetical protein